MRKLGKRYSENEALDLDRLAHATANINIKNVKI